MTDKEVASEEEEWVVQAVEDKRVREDGATEYSVKWWGWADCNSTHALPLPSAPA